MPRSTKNHDQLASKASHGNSSDELQLEKHMVPAQRMIVFQVVPDSGAGFSARAAEHPIFIQGDTVAELEQNTDDAVRCHFGETEPPPRITFRFDNAESQPA